MQPFVGCARLLFLLDRLLEDLFSFSWSQRKQNDSQVENSIDGNSSSSSSVDVAVNMSNNNNVTIGGVTLKLRATKAQVQEVDSVLYKKEQRPTEPEKLQELFQKATSSHHKKYDFINITICLT